MSEEGVILFHVGQEQVWLPYQGKLAEQAYDFVNRLFSLKEALIPARDAQQPEVPAVVWDERGEWESEWRW